MSATLYSSLKAFKPKSPKGRLDLVFPNLFGEPANRTGIGRHGLRPALETAGIDKNITPHSLRHTSASMLIRAWPEGDSALGVPRARRRDGDAPGVRALPQGEEAGRVALQAAHGRLLPLITAIIFVFREAVRPFTKIPDSRG